MFLLLSCIIVILITLVILFTTSSTSGDNCGSRATISPTPTTTETPFQENCDSGWIDGRSVGLGCIFISDSGMNYATSIQFCSDKESHLIEIHSPQQREFVASRLSVNTFWVGATNPNEKTTWYWTVSGEVVKDFIWNTGEPGTEYKFLCLANSGFYGHDCTDNTRYPICQKLSI